VKYTVSKLGMSIHHGTLNLPAPGAVNGSAFSSSCDFWNQKIYNEDLLP